MDFERYAGLWYEIAHAPNWAIVSGPKKKSLFILARQAPMDKDLLNTLLSDLKIKGYDTEKLVFDTYQ